MKAEYLTVCGPSDLCFNNQKKKKIGEIFYISFFWLNECSLLLLFITSFTILVMTSMCFQNVFCMTAKTKDTNFRKLGHDWFNKEAWQGSIHYISVTAYFEQSTKVAYFQQPRSVIPIASQFAYWKSYTESLLDWGGKGQIMSIYTYFFESFQTFTSTFFIFI